MININELRRLAQAATPGPWKMLPVGDGRQKFAVANSEFLSILTVTDEGGATFGTVYDDADARFIAAANPTTINELLDRLEAAEKAVTEAYQRGYATGQEEIEKERDALRALVVMRFDHDYPPQFTQGHDLHELTEPVTAEHCRWFVAEIERLRTDCDALRAEVESWKGLAAQFSKEADKAKTHLAFAKDELNHLRTKVEAMERQEPLWFIDERGEPQRYHKSKADYCKYGGLDLLYALPGAKGE